MKNGRQSRVDARALVARLNIENKTLREREIIAPLLPGGRIRTQLNGMIHEFRFQTPFVGWGRFRPQNERDAELIAEALPWERGGYLELFPLLRMILLWPDPDPKRPGTWWAIPYNESDARQRFGFGDEPLPVFLCDPTNGAERFERVLTRVDGNNLWFEGPDLIADPTHAEWLRDRSVQVEQQDRLLSGLAASERQTLLLWQIRQIELETQPERQRREEQRHRQSAADRQRIEEIRQLRREGLPKWLLNNKESRQLYLQLHHALSKADAVLHSYNEVLNPDGTLHHLIVEWSERGQRHRYRSSIDSRLNIVSSGICLSGRDRDFDLTSIVHVMARRT